MEKLAPPDCDASVVVTAVPEVVDPKGALASYYEHLAALARGRAADHVRVATHPDAGCN